MRTKIILSVLIGVLVVGAVTVGGCYLMMMHPRVLASTSAPVSIEKYRAECPWMNLPSSASNIWYVFSSVGLGGRASLYRFDAPLTECRAYAQGLITKTNGSAQERDGDSIELMALTASPHAVDHAFLRKAYGLEATEWFDVETIRAGWQGRGSPSGLALIWIDAERGRFYYYWTD